MKTRLPLRPLFALLAGTSAACAMSPDAVAGEVPSSPEPTVAKATPVAGTAMVAAPAKATPKPASARAPEPPATAEANAAAERASLLRLGTTKLAAGDSESALIAFRQVAETDDDPNEQANALLGLARAYRLGGDRVKAAATYELLVRDHPDHPLTPTAFLELGRTLRELGSPKLAIARFYSVLQTAIKYSDGDALGYRRLALTAQFEIANTHLATGNYEEATRFFNRLNLLDLTEADRALARFKSAQARALAGDRLAAVLALQGFIADSPSDTNSPEARFMLATLLGELNRHDESLQVTLDLLRQEHGRATGDAARWRVWQQRTGNQLANEFYSHGEFSHALLVYQALAALDPTPAWRLPVLYQVGLCDERLLQAKDALDTYNQITKLIGDQPGEFADLARMTAWRIQQLSWLIHTQADLTTLLIAPPPPVATTQP